MKEQTILHLMVKRSLLYVIRNRSYSHLKNVPLREHCQFWVIQTEETQHIENKSWRIPMLYIILYLSSLTGTLAGSLLVKPKRYIHV